MRRAILAGTLAGTILAALWATGRLDPDGTIAAGVLDRLTPTKIWDWDA